MAGKFPYFKFSQMLSQLSGEQKKTIECNRYEALLKFAARSHGVDISKLFRKGWEISALFFLFALLSGKIFPLFLNLEIRLVFSFSFFIVATTLIHPSMAAKSGLGSKKSKPVSLEQRSV